MKTEKFNQRGISVTKRIVFSSILIIGMGLSNLGLAKVTGLPDFTELVAKTAPAVVNIQVTQFGDRVRPVVPDGQGSQQPNQEDIPELFRRFFDIPGNPRGGQRDRDRRGSGSGFIVESDGYIITNHHVINEADEIVVRLGDRREFNAELVGSDPQSDIALLKIDATDLPTLAYGSSNELQTGEWVIAIGSPFNFDQTVTAGIVSAKGRSNNAQQYVPFIQSDVAINQGNSGGPLLNMDGEVVGINSWILSSSGGYIGLSFSIPVEIAMQSAEQLRLHGKVSRGLLGVVVGAVTRELAEAMNLDKPTGALVNNVNDGSSADRAGILPGDIILEFQGQTIETWNDLPPMVGLNPPGTEVSLLVSRNGEREVFTAKLDALETDEDGNLQASTSTDEPVNLLGLVVEAIPANRVSALGNPDGGVIISRVENDAAYRAGLRRGDVILMIGNRKVEDIESFEGIVEDLTEGKAVALRIMRNGNSNFIAYTPSAD